MSTVPNTFNQILLDVTKYYSEKLIQYGQTPLGVDWKCEKSQNLRFVQLCKIINLTDHFSINDLGCGYSALYTFLAQKYKNFFYIGIDISKDMIHASTQRLLNKNQVKFILSSKPDQIADYSISSGLFNVRLNYSDYEWEKYIERTLDELNNMSSKGFAFNCLTSYSDADKKCNYLYYADPCILFNLCKNRYSKNVALLHDYDLYEFTILVRKRS